MATAAVSHSFFLLDGVLLFLKCQTVKVFWEISLRVTFCRNWRRLFCASASLHFTTIVVFLSWDWSPSLPNLFEKGSLFFLLLFLYLFMFWVFMVNNIVVVLVKWIHAICNEKKEQLVFCPSPLTFSKKGLWKRTLFILYYLNGLLLSQYNKENGNERCFPRLTTFLRNFETLWREEP